MPGLLNDSIGLRSPRVMSALHWGEHDFFGLRLCRLAFARLGSCYATLSTGECLPHGGRNLRDSILQCILAVMRSATCGPSCRRWSILGMHGSSWVAYQARLAILHAGHSWRPVNNQWVGIAIPLFCGWLALSFPLFELVYGNIGQKSDAIHITLTFRGGSYRPSQPQASVIVIVIDGLGTHRTLGLSVCSISHLCYQHTIGLPYSEYLYLYIYIYSHNPQKQYIEWIWCKVIKDYEI